MAPLIPIAVGARAAESARPVLTGDLATIRYRKPSKTIGKGKHKRKIPEKDVELHINPTSLAIGALALGAAGLVGGAALYASGLNVKRTEQKEIVRVMRTTYKDGNPTQSVIMTNRGVPIRYVQNSDSDSNFLTDKDIERGWVLGSVTTTKEGYKVATLRNSTKKGYRLAERSPTKLIDIGGGLF